MGSDSRSSKRKKKRSQKHSKKSRSTKEKSKTKKPKRRHDSESSSGEDVPSKLSLSCSSSSSEDVYRSKKRGRSRDRRDRKSSKKRTKRGRSMSETSDESPRVKKKRKSKSSKDSKLKKKKRRKIHRREHSISSSSCPSRNFCPSEHSNDSEREHERKEKKSEAKKRKGRETSRERSVSKSRHSSRSYSPYNHNEERMDFQPKRLKSVIVVEIEKEEPKVGELIRDSHEDEIVYDHDDYPSKSNDSYDGPSGKDAVTDSDDADHEKTRSFEDPNRETISPPVVRAPELSEKRTERVVIPSSLEPGVGDHVNVGSNPDNLEAKLRQKALENLLKRQAKGLANISTDKKEYHQGPRPEPNKRVFVQTEIEPKSDVKSSSPVQNESVTRQTNNKEGRMQPAQQDEKNVDVVHTKSALGTLNSNNPLPGYAAEKGNASVGHTLIRPKVGLSTSSRRLLGSSNTWRRESTPQEPLKSSQTLSKETDFTMGVQSDPPGTKVVKVDHTTASEPSPSVVKSTKIENKEDDDDSEFQQKTMTVMRGGELVQVSYKVKIPKKAPALARRQLKR